MMRKLSPQRRKLIRSLVLCLILSGLLVAYVLFVYPLASQTTAEEPGTKEVPTTSQNTIESENTSAQPAPEKGAYTEDELFCMAAVIYNEAGGDMCSDEHRAMVGYVVLNRVNDPRYPDSIREVLEQRGQYAGMGNGVVFAARCTKPEEAHAVERAYRIAQEVLENRNNIPIPENVVFQAEFKQGIGVYKYIEGTYFCYAKEVN